VFSYTENTGCEWVQHTTDRSNNYVLHTYVWWAPCLAIFSRLNTYWIIFDPGRYITRNPYTRENVALNSVRKRAECHVFNLITVCLKNHYFRTVTQLLKAKYAEKCYRADRTHSISAMPCAFRKYFFLISSAASITHACGEKNFLGFQSMFNKSWRDGSVYICSLRATVVRWSYATVFLNYDVWIKRIIKINCQHLKTRRTLVTFYLFLRKF